MKDLEVFEVVGWEVCCLAELSFYECLWIILLENEWWAVIVFVYVSLFPTALWWDYPCITVHTAELQLFPSVDAGVVRARHLLMSICMHLIPDICQFFADKRGRKWSSRINKFDILKRRKKKKSRNDEAYFRTSPYSGIIHPLQTVTQAWNDIQSLPSQGTCVSVSVCVWGCQFWAVPYYRP